MTNVDFVFPDIMLGNTKRHLLEGAFAWIAHTLGGKAVREKWDALVFELVLESGWNGLPVYYCRDALLSGQFIELMGEDTNGDVIIYNDLDCGEYQRYASVQLSLSDPDAMDRRRSKRKLISQYAMEL